MNHAVDVQAPALPPGPATPSTRLSIPAQRTAQLATDQPTVLGAPKFRSRLSSLITLLRPRQWLKGVLVLLAPLLTAPLAAFNGYRPLLLTLIAFLAASSTIYIFNDLLDRGRDRLHPVKRLRPLASGQVSPASAITLLACLFLLTIGLMLALPGIVSLVIAVYLTANVWYCLRLKHQPLVDVSFVAVGFSLRVLAGGLAIGLSVQPFLLICIYCACLALSLGKRRHELVIPTSGRTSATAHRPALTAYSVTFLDQLIVINLTAALIGYVAFIWQQQPPYGPTTAALTFPFAAFTVFRYLQMLMVERAGGEPVEDLARDRPMLVSCGFWLAGLVSSMVVNG